MGVNVIVTIRELNFRKYKVINSLSAIKNWDNVDYLIYNRSLDKIPTVLAMLHDIVTKVKGLVYVNDQMLREDDGDVLYTYFKNNKAYIYTDVEEMLGDEDTLDYVIENLGEVGTELALPNENIIDLLKNQIAQLSAGQITQSRLETINGIAEEMGTKLVISEKASRKMTDVLVDISTSLNDLRLKESDAHSKILELSAQVEDMAARGSSMSISDYIEPYDVPPVTKNVAYVKSFGDVPFLLSFFKFYTCYLRQFKQLNYKLLILRPNLPIYDRIYSRDKSIFKLDSTNIELCNVSKYTTFVTYEPSKLIFDKFFDKDMPVSSDGYIVLDFTQHNELLVKGHMVTFLGAFNSIHTYSQLYQDKVEPTHTIFPIKGHSMGIWIPYLNGYADTADNFKESAYVKACMVNYGDRMAPYLCLDMILNIT